MKTVKKILSTIIVIIIVFACNEPTEFGPQETTQKTDFHLEAEIIDQPITKWSSWAIEVNNVTSCNLGQSVIIYMRGVTHKNEQLNAFEVPYGNIEFSIPGTGCVLTGVFEGYAISDAERLNIDATIFIHHGYGTFEADGGNLSLSILGVKIPDNLMRYEIKVNGYLEKRIPTI